MLSLLIAFLSLGRWGEDPKVVPPFAPTEERRAPKVPAGDKIWKELQAEQRWERVDGALLVCHLQVGHVTTERRIGRDILTAGLADLFNADVTLKLKLRRDPTITLWGPAKHDRSYVSVPALALKRGDRLQMSIIDRSIFGDRALGGAGVVWDGRSPLSFATGRWQAVCVLADGAEARRRAEPWLASLDKQLDTIARAEVNRELVHFGRPTMVIAQLTGRFKEAFTHAGNFRYAAGFVGWGDDEIQRRLQRLRALEDAFDAAAAREVRAIRDESRKGGVIVDGQHIGIAAMRGARLALTVAGDGELACGALLDSLGRIELIDANGWTLAMEASLRDTKGRRCDWRADESLMVRAPLRGTARWNSPRPVQLVRTPEGDYTRID